ncbi:MAG: glycosyltransferase family 39 protein [Acidimicrobiales bacterium]
MGKAPGVSLNRQHMESGMEDGYAGTVAGNARSSGVGDTGHGRFASITLKVLVGLVIAFAILLRFWTRSDLWLDEALTVNIAHLPVSQIPAALRRDGAPPLYYVLLHYWMDVLGTSNLAARSLAGLFGVATLPVAWACGKRIGGRVAAWGTVLLLAVSPFAIYYDTEARMYSLVVLLTGLGFLAVDRVLRKPTALNLAAVALVTAALLYTQYWALYLVGVVGLWLLYRAFAAGKDTDKDTGRDAGGVTASATGVATGRVNPLAAFGAMAVGCLTFLPWMPIFLFQAHHTGTPWIRPAGPEIIVHVLSVMGGGISFGGRLLFLVVAALAVLGLFGAANGRLHIDLDLRMKPRGRALAAIIAGTLLTGLIGGYVSHSAFVSRYASVVFLLITLLSAVGLLAIADTRIRNGVLAVAVVGGLVASLPNITTNRTQAGEIATTLARHGKPGDVVAYCPDQLGPAVNRLLPKGRYLQTTFPRGTGPTFVNWIDYKEAVSSVSPASFANHLESMRHGTSQIWVVWAPGYLGFGDKCQQIIQHLQDAPTYRWQQMVVTGPFFEGMGMFRFVPR